MRVGLECGVSGAEWPVSPLDLCMLPPKVLTNQGKFTYFAKTWRQHRIWLYGFWQRVNLGINSESLLTSSVTSVNELQFLHLENGDNNTYLTGEVLL